MIGLYVKQSLVNPHILSKMAKISQSVSKIHVVYCMVCYSIISIVDCYPSQLFGVQLSASKVRFHISMKFAQLFREPVHVVVQKREYLPWLPQTAP